ENIFKCVILLVVLPQTFDSTAILGSVSVLDMVVHHLGSELRSLAAVMSVEWFWDDLNIMKI
ncbi:hypothetical protein A2U01_0117228, partial [Trifolium medium]|nr:hypothetical protein [Trifolium medium]